MAVLAYTYAELARPGTSGVPWWGTLIGGLAVVLVCSLLLWADKQGKVDLDFFELAIWLVMLFGFATILYAVGLFSIFSH